MKINKNDDFEVDELSTDELKLLLEAHDYTVDSEGYILDEVNERIPSEEIPKEFLRIDNLAAVTGSFKLIEASPTAISKYFREKIEINGNSECR